MSQVKQKCELNDCNRAASTRCYCCNKSVCTRHFTEHIEAIRAQIDPLADTINTMAEKIRDLSTEQVKEASFAILSKWKSDTHQLVDEIFWKKIQEIEGLVEENKEKFTEHKTQQWEIIMKIQDEVRQLAEDGDATFEQIKMLKNKLADIERTLTSFRVNFLSINTQLPGQGLVTVSSNQSVSSKESVSSNSNFHAPAKQSNAGFGGSSISQGTPASHTPSASSFAFGTSTSTQSPFAQSPFGGFSCTTPATTANIISMFGRGIFPSALPLTTSTNTSFSFGTASGASTAPTTSIFGTTTITTTASNNSTGFGATPSFGAADGAIPYAPTIIYRK